MPELFKEGTHIITVRYTSSGNVYGLYRYDGIDLSYASIESPKLYFKKIAGEDALREKDIWDNTISMQKFADDYRRWQVITPTERLYKLSFSGEIPSDLVSFCRKEKIPAINTHKGFFVGTLEGLLKVKSFCSDSTFTVKEIN